MQMSPSGSGAQFCNGDHLSPEESTDGGSGGSHAQLGQETRADPGPPEEPKRNPQLQLEKLGSSPCTPDQPKEECFSCSGLPPPPLANPSPSLWLYLLVAASWPPGCLGQAPCLLPCRGLAGRGRLGTGAVGLGGLSSSRGLPIAERFPVTGLLGATRPLPLRGVRLEGGGRRAGQLALLGLLGLGVGGGLRLGRRLAGATKAAMEEGGRSKGQSSRKQGQGGV